MLGRLYRYIKLALYKGESEGEQIRELYIKNLPSLGLFYPKDMKIFISKVSIDDIKVYYDMYDETDYIEIFGAVKYIVRKSCIFNETYIFEHITSVDIMYIFLEIVKFTMGKDIEVIISDKDSVIFNEKSFNYFKLSKEQLSIYNDVERAFVYKGFKYSLPTIGAEISLTNFLLQLKKDEMLEIYADISYDFLYFLGGKIDISVDEMKNLIEIFNYDLTSENKIILKKFIKEYKDFAKYSIIYNDEIIPLENISLSDIWEL